MIDRNDKELIVGCKLRSTRFKTTEATCLGLIPGWVILIQDMNGAFPWLISAAEMEKSRWEIYEYPEDKK